MSGLIETAIAVLLTTVNIFGQDMEMQKVRCTCYVATGHRTSDGTVPYEGIIASNREHLGQTAMLYTMEGQFIGFFEARDLGGHKMLRNGTAIDVYRDSLDRAYEWVSEYGDYVQVIWLLADG